MRRPQLYPMAGKGVVLILGVIGATLLAALYGALHDQITYTLSPDYYTRFKFAQFGIEIAPGASPLDLRLGVARVGVLATWWMGAALGLILGMLGLIQRDGRQMAHVLWRSTLIVLAAAILVAVAFGLSTDWLLSQPGAERVFWHPPGLRDTLAFDRVGLIHSGSYLGGALGGLLAILYGIAHRLRAR